MPSPLFPDRVPLLTLWALYSWQKPARHVLGIRNVPLLEFVDECQQHVRRTWDHTGMRLLGETAQQPVGRGQSRNWTGRRARRRRALT
jgi:hypothetical protein